MSSLFESAKQDLRVDDQPYSALVAFSSELTPAAGSASESRIVLTRGTAWCALILLLISELLLLALPYDVRADLPLQSFGANALRLFERGIRPAVITAMLVAAFFSRETLQDEFRRATAKMGAKVIAWPWLVVHFGLLAVLIEGTIAHRPGRLGSVIAWESWLLLWVLLASAAFVTWCFSLLPPRFWVRWISRSHTPFALGATIGLTAFTLGALSGDLWLPLQRSTFAMVVFLLQLVGQRTVVVPADFIIGTPGFTVTIVAGCSGIEGISLVVAFFAAYLWYCRHELRFPNALVLIPLGIISIWLLNVVRIAALILLGNWNPEAAVKGFHSVAGWIFFNAVAGGLVWASSRSNWFLRASAIGSDPNPATPYLLPMLMIIATSMVAQAFSPGLDGLYTVGIVVALPLFYYYRAEFVTRPWRITPLPVLAGLVVATFWIVRAGTAAYSDVILAPVTLSALPSLWTKMALIGGLIAVPAATELAFRGYLFRRLIDPNFSAVPSDQFSLLPLVGSSATCGLIHVHWMPAMLAGVVFALVMNRRGRLSDAIIAHLTCTASIFIYVLVLHGWAL